MHNDCTNFTYMRHHKSVKDELKISSMITVFNDTGDKTHGISKKTCFIHGGCLCLVIYILLARFLTDSLHISD
jgi:hypothetical protein